MWQKDLHLGIGYTTRDLHLTIPSARLIKKTCNIYWINFSARGLRTGSEHYDPAAPGAGGGGAFKTCTLYILRSIRKEGLFCYTIHFICLQLLLKVPLGPIGNGIRSISHLSIRVGLWFGGILTCMRKRTETQTHRQTHMDATENITSCTNTGGKNVSL